MSANNAQTFRSGAGRPTLGQLHMLLARQDLLVAPSTSDAAALLDDVAFDRVTHDSRLVEPGSLFVAVSGEQVDGHRFIASAVAAGAVAVVGTQPLELLADRASGTGRFRHPAVSAHGRSVPYLAVQASRPALALAAALLYAFPSRDMAVIGVTGTDGKTTTCTILESILDAAAAARSGAAGPTGVITTVGARIGGVEQDTGFHVTTPDAPEVQRYLAQMRAAGCRYAVVESTSHGLAQARVAAVDFDVAAVTNITHEHLDYHGSREAYVAAKALLFRALFASPPKPGIPRVAVLNADDPGSIDALAAVIREEREGSDVPVRSLVYGIRGGDEVPSSRTPDVWADEIDDAPDRTRFVLHWWQGAFPVESHLIGRFNVSNILCAATAALAQGVSPAAVQQGVAGLRGVVGRMERMDRGQDFLALVDFAHSPASLERALMALRTVVERDRRGGRVIAVFGSAGLRDRAKRGLMGQVSGRLADFTVITAEDPRTESLDEINAAIAAGVRMHAAPDTFAVIPDRAEAIRYAVDMAQPGDVVAAFGKGHERSMCFGETEYPWSDQAAMEEALTRRQARMRLKREA